MLTLQNYVELRLGSNQNIRYSMQKRFWQEWTWKGWALALIGLLLALHIGGGLFGGTPHTFERNVAKWVVTPTQGVPAVHSFQCAAATPKGEHATLAVSVSSDATSQPVGIFQLPAEEKTRQPLSLRDGLQIGDHLSADINEALRYFHAEPGTKSLTQADVKEIRQVIRAQVKDLKMTDALNDQDTDYSIAAGYMLADHLFVLLRGGCKAFVKDGAGRTTVYDESSEDGGVVSLNLRQLLRKGEASIVLYTSNLFTPKSKKAAATQPKAGDAAGKKPAFIVAASPEEQAAAVDEVRSRGGMRDRVEDCMSSATEPYTHAAVFIWEIKPAAKDVVA